MRLYHWITRRYASLVIWWYDLIHSTWYSTPDQVTIMIMCIYFQSSFCVRMQIFSIRAENKSAGKSSPSVGTRHFHCVGTELFNFRSTLRSQENPDFLWNSDQGVATELSWRSIAFQQSFCWRFSALPQRFHGAHNTCTALSQHFALHSAARWRRKCSTVKTLYSVTRYNRIFNIRHKFAGHRSVSIKIPSL